MNQWNNLGKCILIHKGFRLLESSFEPLPSQYHPGATSSLTVLQYINMFLELVLALHWRWYLLWNGCSSIDSASLDVGAGSRLTLVLATIWICSVPCISRSSQGAGGRAKTGSPELTLVLVLMLELAPEVAVPLCPIVDLEMVIALQFEEPRIKNFTSKKFYQTIVHPDGCSEAFCHFWPNARIWNFL